MSFDGIALPRKISRGRYIILLGHGTWGMGQKRSKELSGHNIGAGWFQTCITMERGVRSPQMPSST